MNRIDRTSHPAGSAYRERFGSHRDVEAEVYQLNTPDDSLRCFKHNYATRCSGPLQHFDHRWLCQTHAEKERNRQTKEILMRAIAAKEADKPQRLRKDRDAHWDRLDEALDYADFERTTGWPV